MFFLINTVYSLHTVYSFIHFKLADQHAYSSMHDKKALSTKAQIQILQFL